MNLAERMRPQSFNAVVGQDKAIRSVGLLRERGFGGRAILLTGKTGQGKTTIARLIANEFSGDWGTIEIDATGLTAGDIERLIDRTRTRPMNGQGWTIICNEIQGMTKGVLTKLLTALEIPSQSVCWIFTVMVENLESLQDKFPDFRPFTGRCNHIALAQRMDRKKMAPYLLAIARAEKLDGKPVSAYERLYDDCGGSMRECLTRIESGYMLD